MCDCLEILADCGSKATTIAAFGLLAIIVTACGGGNAGAEPTALPPETVPDNPTIVFPTLAPLEPGPTLTPTPEPVEEASGQVDTEVLVLPPVTEGMVNTEGLRFRDAPDIGTGVVMAELRINTILYIYGRNPESTWLNVAREAGGRKGWVYASYVNLDRSVEQLPEADEFIAGTPSLAARSTPDFNEAPSVAQFFIEAIAVPLQAINLRETPNGISLTQVPKGEYVTAMARSNDGLWLAVYTNALILEDRQYGWVALSEVKLYDGEELPRTGNDAPWLELPN